MKRILLAATLSALCACATARVEQNAPAVTPVTQLPAASLTKRDVAKLALPASVRIFLESNGQPRRSGTGVVIAKEVASTGSASYIVTNAHVIDDRGMEAPRLRVVVERGPEAFEYEGEFVAAGSIPDMDLALIRISGVLLEPAVLAADTEVEPGDEVLVVAAPFGRGLTLAGGMVSQIDYDRSTRAPKVLKTDAAVGFGSSGGGLFSLKDGKLLAIVEGYRTTKVGFAMQGQDVSFDLPMPGETFAVPAAKLRRFIGEKGYAHLLGGARESQLTAR